MLTIGAVARQAGVRNSAVRYYEARGLIRSARRPNGYRVYDEDAVSLLNFVRRVQALGITLKEAKKLLDLSRRGRQPCTEVRALAREHLTDLDRKIRELQLLRGQLQSLLRRRSRRTARGTVCPLIEK